MTSSAAFALLVATGITGCATTSPAIKVQSLASGVLRVDLGNLAVTAISDGSLQRPVTEGFVRNVSISEIEKALRDAGLPSDKITFPYIPLLVESGGKRILIDAGNGEFSAPTTGKLLEKLTSIGISAESIDAVILSHLHGDHINGLRNKAGAFIFSKAQIYVPRPEWNYWMDDQRMKTAPEMQQRSFQNVRRVFSPIAHSVSLFEPGVELFPGIRSIPAFGHTVGHTAFIIDGTKRKLLYWADASNVDAVFLRNIDWNEQFVADEEAARLTRRRLADMVIRENMLLAGYHLSGSGIGDLIANGNAYLFKPLNAGATP